MNEIVNIVTVQTRIDTIRCARVRRNDDNPPSRVMTLS